MVIANFDKLRVKRDIVNSMCASGIVIAATQTIPTDIVVINNRVTEIIIINTVIPCVCCAVLGDDVVGQMRGRIIITVDTMSNIH